MADDEANGSDGAGPDGVTRSSHPDDEPYECRGHRFTGTAVLAGDKDLIKKHILDNQPI